MKILIANDHRGYNLKNKIVRYLIKKGHQPIDIGCNSTSPVDYPLYAFDLGERLVNGEGDMGIVICRTGVGVTIACNKVKGIRCAKPNSVLESKLSRTDEDANVLTLSACQSYFRNLDILDAFLNTPFSHEERHQRRMDLITEYENKPRKNKTKEDL